MARTRPPVSKPSLFNRSRARLAQALVPCDDAERAALVGAASERRRIARDLHDGPAQELAFLAMQCRDLALRTGDPSLAALAESADRALAQTKEVVYGLAEGAHKSLDSAVYAAAADVAARSGATVRVDCDARADAPAETRQELARIVREAVWNGVRHGEATSFAIELCRDEGLHLRIADNGAGYDPGMRPEGATGFGLESMRERAAALGGDLAVRSVPGQGTEVEVSLP